MNTKADSRIAVDIGKSQLLLKEACHLTGIMSGKILFGRCIADDSKRRILPNAKKEYILGYDKNSLSIIQSTIDARNHEYLWVYTHPKVLYNSNYLQWELLRDSAKYLCCCYNNPQFEGEKLDFKKCVTCPHLQESDLASEEDFMMYILGFETFFDKQRENVFKVLEQKGYVFYRTCDDDLNALFKRVYRENKNRGILGSEKLDNDFEEVKKPEITANEVLINVEAVGIEVDTKWMNKKVGVFPLIPCKKCSSCQNETYEMCSHYNYLGSRCNGGLAEYVAVPSWNLLELPEQFDLRQAAMLEPASVALHAIRRLELKEESIVALLGLGPIGTIMTQWLSYYGVKNVMATGHRAEFGEVMKKTADSDYCFANAHETDSVRWIKEQTDGLGADIVIDCVNNLESLTNCIECVKPGGQILMVGNPHGDIQVEKKIYWQILRKQVTIKGTWNSSFVHKEDDDWHMVIKACEEGKLKLSPYTFISIPASSSVCMIFSR